MAKNISNTKSTEVDTIAIVSLIILGILFVSYLIALAIKPSLREGGSYPAVQTSLLIWFGILGIVKASKSEKNKEENYDGLTFLCALVAIVMALSLL